MLFCGRWLIAPQRWDRRLLRTSFWSLNVGLALMVVMDLFPVGVDQLLTVLERGYAYARSQAYVQGTAFQAYTWLRGVGVGVFVVGGLLPLVWFLVTRWRSLKPPPRAGAPEGLPASLRAFGGAPEETSGRG